MKEEKDAVILAHYDVEPEVQEIADYVGDSFQLSKIAADISNKTLVFCGVHFMGESGCLLSPEKAVLLPDLHADCPRAHMVTKQEADEAGIWRWLPVISACMKTFEKYAVKVGGGANHRYNLSDGVLLKDNHIDAAVFDSSFRRCDRCDGEPQGLWESICGASGKEFFGRISSIREGKFIIQNTFWLRLHNILVKAAEFYQWRFM